MSILGGLFGKNHGAPESKILEAEAATGLKFPASYRKFISESDGKLFKKQSVEILSLEKSVEYFQNLRELGITQTWGYFPILDNNDSNPWCVCCNAPLAGYIVQVNHDDSAKIKLRNIESLITKIQSDTRGDDFWLDDLEGDFQSSSRTSQDITVAQELVRNASNYKDANRNDACRFAMWLFGDDQVEQITPFLDDEDSFVARDASERLKAMRSIKAKQAIESSEKDFLDFVQGSLNSLKKAGIQADLQNPTTIYLSPGYILLNMEMFYAERKSPGAEQKLIERSKKFIADKQTK